MALFPIVDLIAGMTIDYTHNGKVLRFSGSGAVTVHLTPAQLLEQGWNCSIINHGTADITVTTTETINGLSSLTVSQGSGYNMYSDSNVFLVVSGAHGGEVASITAGRSIAVDASDPAHPVVSTLADIDAGASGTAGSVDVFPTTAVKGKLSFVATNSAGNTTTTVTNASQAGARTYTVPDAGASAFFSMQASQAVSADGAITIKDGTAWLTKAGVAATTLAAPTATTDDGKTLVVYATTANAHTVTQTTPGFNNGGAASDVATFGGAIGDNLVLRAYQGAWYVVSSVNGTLA